MREGEELLRFLASLMLQGCCGTVTIRFEAGKVTHVEKETRRAWEYRQLPTETGTELTDIAAERPTTQP